jgi:hypothetical protein
LWSKPILTFYYNAGQISDVQGHAKDAFPVLGLSFGGCQRRERKSSAIVFRWNQSNVDSPITPKHSHISNSRFTDLYAASRLRQVEPRAHPAVF